MQAEHRQDSSHAADTGPNTTPEEWQAKLDQLHSTNELLRVQKATVENDLELFRNMYGKASAHVSEVTAENNTLEERATLAEGQARDGIAMVKATYEARIQRLEEEVEKWKGLYEVLLLKDTRTNGDEIRRRAALEGELEIENQDLRKELELLREDYEKMEAVLEQLGEQELEQLGEQEAGLTQTIGDEQSLQRIDAMVAS
ncbi:hypothetical protein BXZ70DRAFT_901561 [Cristinia sonorae]|uniref:Uncharacterized protein n=1 Tax=Cristinia sonorae TaxID=1940300 RepID=A0A8K0XK88_9AGAR|nr:hypothetical protein BXZ70DRAFT_901561 [Cristinia sonorae]